MRQSLFMIREGNKLLESHEWFKQGLDRLTPEQKTPRPNEHTPRSKLMWVGGATTRREIDGGLDHRSVSVNKVNDCDPWAGLTDRGADNSIGKEYSRSFPELLGFFDAPKPGVQREVVCSHRGRLIETYIGGQTNAREIAPVQARTKQIHIQRKDHPEAYAKALH
jgi:hypothetical protein